MLKVISLKTYSLFVKFSPPLCSPLVVYYHAPYLLLLFSCFVPHFEAVYDMWQEQSTQKSFNYIDMLVQKAYLPKNRAKWARSKWSSKKTTNRRHAVQLRSADFSIFSVWCTTWLHWGFMIGRLIGRFAYHVIETPLISFEIEHFADFLLPCYCIFIPIYYSFLQLWFPAHDNLSILMGLESFFATIPMTSLLKGQFPACERHSHSKEKQHDYCMVPAVDESRLAGKVHSQFLFCCFGILWHLRRFFLWLSSSWIG